jgi:hypothetical protein
MRLGRAWDRFGGLRPTARGLLWLALAAGAVFRVGEAVALRPWWEDELSLRRNVVERPLLELDRSLVERQVAPPGYLVGVRAWERLAGDSRWSLRFPSLVCGTLALGALAILARRVVDSVAVPLAVALAAVSDDLIYYANEFKQYSSDLLLTLIALGVGLNEFDRRWTPGRMVLLAVGGGLAAWFSHPLAFILAGIGLTWAAVALGRRQWGRLAAVMGVGAFWLANIIGCAIVSDFQIDAQARAFLWAWWDFAFLRLPPRSFEEAVGVFWQFLNVFVNPVGLQTPFNPLVTAWTGFGLWLLGLVALWRRGRERRGAVGLVVGPILLTMAVSAMGRYPFHGRVLLFLVPTFLLPVAEGVAAVGHRLGRWAMAALVVFLLLAPTGVALVRLGAGLHRSRVFDSHADQRYDLLDYLESSGSIGFPGDGRAVAPVE